MGVQERLSASSDAQATLSDSLIVSRRLGGPRAKLAALTFSAAEILAACSGNSAPALTTSEPQSPSPKPTQMQEAVLGASDQLPSEDPNSLVLPFPRGETWYLTQGIHENGTAIDIAPKQVVSCIDNAGNHVWNDLPSEWVTASESGKVVLVGDQKDRNDPNHSIVKIQGVDNTKIMYVHLDNIKVTDGQTVFSGDPLGNPSCEFPNSDGGNTTGVHVHLAVVGGISGETFSGWTVQGNELISKNPDATREADGSRCGPETNCMDSSHNHFRNDLTRGALIGGTEGIGNVTGAGNTSIPYETPAATQENTNLTVDQKIDQALQEYIANPETHAKAVALKLWLNYLNETQIPKFQGKDIPEAYTSQILVFDSFASQIPALMDGQTTTPDGFLEVLQKATYSTDLVKQEILIRITGISLDTDLIAMDGGSSPVGIKFSFEYAEKYEQIFDPKDIFFDHSKLNQKKVQDWLNSPSTLEYPQLSDVIPSEPTYVTFFTNKNSETPVLRDVYGSPYSVDAASGNIHDIMYVIGKSLDPITDGQTFDNFTQANLNPKDFK